MEILKESDFRKEIKSAPRSGYLLFGEEDYLKAFAVQTARDVLCPDPTYAFFNEIRMTALDFDPARLPDALMPVPMMADRKLITLSGLNFNTMKPNELDALCAALEGLREYDYNVFLLVVAADGLNPGFLPKKPSPTLTRLCEHLTPVQFEPCTTAKLSAWVQKHFAHNGVEASPALCARLPEYCGHSMFVLANEIDKLSYYTLSHGEKEVTEQNLQKVCTPANEYDAFAFANAVMEGRADAALAVLSDYKFRRVDPIIILGDVIRTVCDMIDVRAMVADGASNAEIAAVLKLHEFKVGLYQKALRRISDGKPEEMLAACRDADASLKLSPQGYAPLEQLICTL